MTNFNIKDYLKEAKVIENLFINFVAECDDDNAYKYTRLSSTAKPIQRELLQRYEIWFAVTKLIVRQYSDRYETFEGNYSDLKTYILIGVTQRKDVLINNFIDSFDAQVNILYTIIPIISLKETDFKKIITADILESELEQAEVLFKYDFHRAAGSIAGVVLERYLKTLCEVNLIAIGDKDTIEPLATKLYKSDKLPDFDKTLFKSIQHIASIRNKCSHPKEEVKQHEVRELLDKVKKITFLSL